MSVSRVQSPADDHVAEPEAGGTRRRRARRIGWILPLCLVVAWEVLTVIGVIDRRFFPSPSMIATGAARMAADGDLLPDTLLTISRIAAGFAIGGVLGYSVGLVTGVFLSARRIVEPTLSAIYTVPKIALLPVFLTIFGFGEAPKIALVSLTVFFYVWIYTMEAVVQIPRGYRDAARSFRVTRRQELVHVVMPATLPSVFTGLRVAIAVAVLVTISAEYIVGGSGLGYLIFNSRALFKVEDAFVGIVVVALLGYVLQLLVMKIGRRVTRWHGSAPVATVRVNV